MSKAVWLHLKFGEPPPWELVEWTMAREFGWTLDYIRSLPLSDVHDWMQITDGRAKAMPEPSRPDLRKFRRR